MNTNFNKEEFINTSIDYKEYVKQFLEENSKNNEGYVYIRVSSTGQLENSPKAQLRDILEFAKTQNIWIPKENIFVDGGISGRTIKKRTDFQCMLNKATSKENKAKYVLIHKYDRYARNKEESVISESSLRKAGIKLIAVQQLLPQDKVASVILKNTYEVNSEIYSLNLSNEVYKGLRIQAESGKHMTKAIYGYKKEIVGWRKDKNKRDKPIRKMVIREDEAKIVRLIFEKFVNGTTKLQIAKDLNDMGLKTRDGIPWYDNRVDYILTNITYKGFSHWTEKEKETTIARGDYEPIIEENVFNRAQEIMEAHRLPDDSILRDFVKNDHWLRGLIRCSNCGNTLVLNGGSYQCCLYTHGGCKESHSIRIFKIENIVLNKLKNIKIDDIINININEIKIKNNNELAILTSRKRTTTTTVKKNNECI